ncbi:MAG: hypothetical protein IPK76_22400 [Lewinellaceae bacterium]|nr:hypothetical protein [Lewinellaceae bacterium]
MDTRHFPIPEQKNEMAYSRQKYLVDGKTGYPLSTLNLPLTLFVFRVHAERQHRHALFFGHHQDVTFVLGNNENPSAYHRARRRFWSHLQLGIFTSSPY